MSASSPPASSPPSESQLELATALRAAATRAADILGGGCALVFASLPGDDGAEAATHLRAAAGFGSAETARLAAVAALGVVRETITSGLRSEREPIAELGASGAAGTIALPLSVGGEVRGVCVAGYGTPPSQMTTDELEAALEITALRLGNAHLSDRIRALDADGRGDAPDPASDELLKLSEALFTQDIELLRSNEKLGKIEKLKNDFIEKMSRELRTPLNSIIEAIIAVLAGENDAISNHAKESLRNALAEGTAFQRTLQNILDLWRIKQNELPMEVQEVKVSEVVEEAIFSVQDSFDESAVTIEKALAPGLPKVRTDLAKINQLLFLLLDNAVKFTPRGTVRISAELVGQRLRCEVQDDGIGICADDQEFIYDEFFQVDAHSSSTYRGAGLGLSLVRDLVVLLDGEIALDSEAGKGTTVRFEIPVEPV